MASKTVTIVGGGLAGCEAAWQCAREGVAVRLIEMRPVKATAVHGSDRLAELVCSNSFKSDNLASGHGLLHAEMRAVGSLIIDAAEASRVPAGSALAVDRDAFAQRVSETLENHPLIDIERREVTEIPSERPAIIAAGPLCSDRLARDISRFTGEDNLAFYDAISPIIEAESIDWKIVFKQSRYDRGEGSDYGNCPMDRAEYDRFYDALIESSKADLHSFDRNLLFEACLPIEELARRGRDTLRYGPMKPVGLRDPRSDARPWAVVQLRQDNLAATHWSMVGFQNQLRYEDQRTVFRLIPGLEKARFVKLGMIHRNTYVNAPRVLRPDFECRKAPGLFLAGQISGVEGYTESSASGMMAGLAAAARARGREIPLFPEDSAMGALQRYIAHSSGDDYQPTNIAFGLLPALEKRPRSKRERKRLMAERALASVNRFVAEILKRRPTLSGKKAATEDEG